MTTVAATTKDTREAAVWASVGDPRQSRVADDGVTDLM